MIHALRFRRPQNLRKFPIFLWRYLLMSKNRRLFFQICVVFSEYLDFTRLLSISLQCFHEILWQIWWSGRCALLSRSFSYTFYHDLLLRRIAWTDPLINLKRRTQQKTRTLCICKMFYYRQVLIKPGGKIPVLFTVVVSVEIGVIQ